MKKKTLAKFNDAKKKISPMKLDAGKKRRYWAITSHFHT